MPRIANKKSIISWCFYDFANGPYSAVITTFVFASYFTQSVAKDVITGTAQWGNAMGVSGILIALLSPLLGAIADREGRRKPWLGMFTLITIIASCMLWFTRPLVADVTRTLCWIVVGTVGLEMGIVFYNAMLRSIAPKGYVGRISGWAWGMSYAANLLCLAIALVGVLKAGLTPRVSGPLVAAWLAVFSLPLFLFTPDQPSSGVDLKVALIEGVRGFVNTLRKVKTHKLIFLFLIARMFYIDGLNTIFAFGGIYAAGSFGFTTPEIIGFGLMMNLSAGLGAVAFAWVDDSIGSKRTILIALFGMLITGISILLIHAKLSFWVIGFFLSLFVGPIQAASRSLMAQIAPVELMSEMFGLYAFSGKATAFLGPLLLGLATTIFQSQRAGMATTLLFIGNGALLLWQLPINGKASQ